MINVCCVDTMQNTDKQQWNMGDGYAIVKSSRGICFNKAQSSHQKV